MVTRGSEILASTDAGEFRWHTPSVVLHGVGGFSRIGEMLDEMSTRRIVLVTSRSIADKTPMIGELAQQVGSALVGTFDACREHSPLSSVDEVARFVVRSKADVVVGIGGGSVCDTIKAARIVVADSGSLVPHVAVPTTLSGSEFTIGIGVTDDRSHLKIVSSDPRAMPEVVILDPWVASWTPAHLWSATGMKAIDHAIEAIWCQRPHPLMSTLAAEGLRRLIHSLPAAVDSANHEARSDCQLGAWMSIIRPGRSAIRLSHLLAHQVGACWNVPHGLTSGVLLPAVMRYLAPVTLPTQGLIAEALGVPMSSDAAANAEAAAVALTDFVTGLGLPTRLRDVVADDAVGLETVADAAYDEAEQLGCTDDLPFGAASVAEVLSLAW